MASIFPHEHLYTRIDGGGSLALLVLSAANNRAYHLATKPRVSDSDHEVSPLISCRSRWRSPPGLDRQHMALSAALIRLGKPLPPKGRRCQLRSRQLWSVVPHCVGRGSSATEPRRAMGRSPPNFPGG